MSRRNLRARAICGIGTPPARDLAVRSLIVALVFLLVPGTALASEPDDPPREGERAARRVAVTINPLALGLARIGGNIEVALARHHAITATAFRASRNVAVRGGDTSESRASVGGELGYRSYFLPRTLEGPFIGASGLVERVVPEDGLLGSVVYGAAVDIGGQIITASGVTFSAGAGLQYTRTSEAEHEVSSYPIFSQPGVSPRLLARIGWAF